MAQEQQRFQLVNTLGRGGMAEVFLGWMMSVGGIRRKVAIKRILPELIQKQGKRFQKMFVDEARLTFQLEHDNIVRVYDIGQTDKTFFIVMEYVEGYDLKHMIEKIKEQNALFPVGVAIYIIMQVCAGLGYAHALTDPDGKPLGLIHNDISPPNILIGRHGEVKVADFGLADAETSLEKTPEGMIKGKFAYISPESTRDPSLISPRSDIFSIGIVLWEMLAGQKLFQRNTDIETFKAVKETRIPDIRKIRDDLPEELITIVHKALAPDPEKRYQTCEDLYHDLSAVALALGIPINRYDLEWLINDLAGNKWKEFDGEKISAEVLDKLQNEIDGMLAPEEQEALKGVVTGMSIATDVSTQNMQADEKNKNWVKEVFNDVFSEADLSTDSPIVPDPGMKKEAGGSAESKSESKKEAVSAPQKTPSGKELPSAVRLAQITPPSYKKIDALVKSNSTLISVKSGLLQNPASSGSSAFSTLAKVGLCILGFVLGIVATIGILLVEYKGILF